MPRAAATSVENNFTKGLITEVTGVNSPENSVSSSLNVIYDRKGRALSRNGLAFEEASVLQPIVQTGVISEFLWETVSNNAGVSFEVVQTGYIIRFFLASGSTSLSAGLKSFQIDLRSYKVGSFLDTDVASARCAFSSGKGYLFIAHPNCETLYVNYAVSTDTITVNKIVIEIRDFEGVPDTIGVDARLTTLTPAHNYNLFNQGWYSKAKIQGGVTPNVMDYWHTKLGNYPSNVDFWWYYVIPDTLGTTTGEDNFTPSTESGKTGLLGNTPSPKGHYVITAMSTNRTGLSGVTVPENSSGGYRPSVVSFFTSRAFYAGIGSSGYSSTIYFSQIIERDDQLGKCYQLNDPTSKEYFDLIASDGGTIKIQDINTILDMKVIGQSLYVFASNGVWAITGSNDGPFKATDYTVSKISAFPAVSRTSIVDVGGLPLWWNYEGIFSLQKTQTGLTTEVTNLSQSTIQTFYDLIPQGSKLQAKGAYNDQAGLVYWLYNQQERTDSVYLNVLALDVITGAFYPFTIPDVPTQVVGLSALRASGLSYVQANIVLSTGDNVVTSGNSQIIINSSSSFVSKSKVFKFITTTPVGLVSNMTFSELRDSTTWLDWGVTPVETDFITGYRIRGDLLKQFQTNYLAVITQEIPNGSCYHQNLWDYSDDPNSGRFSNPQQVYRDRTYRDYQRSKLKTRGNGYSLQFRFFGEAGKPFIIVGWAGFETSNQVP